MRRSICLICLVIPFAAACSSIFGSEDGSLVLQTQRSNYVQGDTVVVAIINETNQLLAFNFCAGGRIVRGEERRAIATTCSLELEELPAGGRSTARLPVTTQWSPGEYRIALQIRSTDGTPAYEAYTRSFTVRAP